MFRAGRAYEESGDLESAALCYREGQAVSKLIDVLEKRGECYEAAQLAFERGDVSRAIRNFQQVDARHERYPDVCRFLAERFSEQGKLELAVQKADEAITFSGASEASADTFAWYGDLLERAGQTERALEAFEELASATGYAGVRSGSRRPGPTRSEALRVDALTTGPAAPSADGRRPRAATRSSASSAAAAWASSTRPATGASVASSR